MKSIISAIVIAVVCFGCLTGCTQNATSQQGVVTVNELPVPALAKEEAKEALKNWQSLLESGRNQDFFLASMPVEVIEKTVNSNGDVTEDILLKVRSLGPKLVGALSEAQFLEPTVAGDKVVFTYTDLHTDGGLFSDDKLYLSKRDGRWFFNGPLVAENLQQ